MLSAGICEDDDDDDDDFNKEYDDEEDDFGLEYLFVISKLQVTRKAKWAHHNLGENARPRVAPARWRRRRMRGLNLADQIQ